MATIVIIDDESSIREELAEALTWEDYTVYTAENGRTGIAIIQQHLPDLVLCDINMPYMNGLEVVKRMRTTPNLAEIPFVFITASQDLDSSSAAAAGADGYITKPFELSELFAICAKYTGNDNIIKAGA